MNGLVLQQNGETLGSLTTGGRMKAPVASRLTCDRAYLAFAAIGYGATLMLSDAFIGSLGESGWRSVVTPNHGAWKHAGIRFLPPGCFITC